MLPVNVRKQLAYLHMKISSISRLQMAGRRTASTLGPVLPPADNELGRLFLKANIVELVWEKAQCETCELAFPNTVVLMEHYRHTFHGPGRSYLVGD